MGGVSGEWNTEGEHALRGKAHSWFLSIWKDAQRHEELNMSKIRRAGFPPIEPVRREIFSNLTEGIEEQPPYIIGGSVFWQSLGRGT